jgi:hypothetical protein
MPTSNYSDLVKSVRLIYEVKSVLGSGQFIWHSREFKFSIPRETSSDYW